MLIYDNATIPIRSIQHFIYCPHRWGLLYIDMAWSENEYVTKANLFHKHVHTEGRIYSKPGVKAYNSVPVYNDNDGYDIYGILDCLEVAINNKGEEKFSVVEYKPTMPKKTEYNYDDIMQVFAQKICVDYMFETNAEAYIYYADRKKRIRLPFDKDNRHMQEDLRNTLSYMREYLNKGIIPHADKTAHCGGCSLKNICMLPPAKASCSTIRDRIEKINKDTE